MMWYWVAWIAVGAWVVGAFGIVVYTSIEKKPTITPLKWWAAAPFRLLPVYIPRLLVWLIETAIPDLLQESIAAWGPTGERKKGAKQWKSNQNRDR